MTEKLLQDIIQRLDRGDSPDSRWPDAKGEYHALCPFHDDHHATNFSVSERGFKCFVCDANGGLKGLAQHLGVEVAPAGPLGLTLARYAAAKRLPLEFLRGLGLEGVRWYGKPAVEIPYRNERGQVVARRVRKALATPDCFRWRKGAKAKGLLYGLWRLPAIHEAGWTLLVEGESDCHTAWLKGLPCLGVPGADMWAADAAKHLDGLEVFVWLEPDLAGTRFVRDIGKDLPGARVVKSTKHKDISAAHLAGEDVGLLVETLKAKAMRIRQAVAGALPEVETLYRPMRDQVTDAMRALEAVNDPPSIFWRSGALARVSRDEDDLPIVEAMSESALRGRLARCVEFTRKLKGGRRTCSPPLDVVRDIMALGIWPFPPLVGIVEVPVLRPDGTVVAEPGYDRATKLYYAPTPGLPVPTIPANPAPDQIEQALTLLIEPMRQFPLVDEASFANALAAMLTPVLRPMIPGCVPMALFDKPQAGTGASLLAEVVATIATGRASAMMAAPGSDEAWRKLITSLLLRGATVAVVDNVEGLLSAPSLGALLTAITWQDRILGESRMVVLPHRMTWVATGNNIRLAGDLPRRCYWVRMDAKCARPWQRTDFEHPDLVGWTLVHRGELVAAALTLARAWVVADRPRAKRLPIMGGFTGWSETVGGVLAHAGIGDFLGNLTEMYDEMAEDVTEWQAFLIAWHGHLEDRQVTVAEFAEFVAAGGGLAEALPADLADARSEHKSFNQHLGQALGRKAEMRFPCGLYVHKGRKKHQATRWSVKGELIPIGEAGEARETNPDQAQSSMKN